MISGLLAPSAANFIQRPNILYNKAKVAEEQQQQQQQQQQQRNGRAERSAALERAYVHDVYENNCDDSCSTAISPRIAQFLSNLEAGSLVCDVGCGNGRYLNACNPYIFSIGVDRCMRLAKEAYSRGEVAVCDNLELPFRNESFDAVLSLSVIHHFATTERRINAIRELARILRIGGRVVITVWALEQKHRRFESQDVLIPTSSSMSTSLRNRSNISDDEDEDDFLPPYHAYTEESTNSSKSAGDGDSSSLSSSSPGESCYSFVRKTFQKLAGGKRHPWFLDSWNSRENKNDNSLDFEDAKDLPIELRRLDDFEDLPPEPPLHLKSRSLSNLNPPQQTIVRSLSSVPSLTATDGILQKAAFSGQSTNSGDHAKKEAPKTGIPTNETNGNTTGVVAGGTKPNRNKLVKQKQSLCDESSFVELDEEAATTTTGPRVLLRKQSSLNEECLSESRQREKVRKRIHKQMSLNETFLYRGVFSKKLQVIREGLTTKLRTSSESMERLKNTGIGRLIQNLKSATPQGQNCRSSAAETNGNDRVHREGANSTTGSDGGGVFGQSCSAHPQGDQVELDEEGKPRRRSRESGSDSSKDSLQSDTSIESEDSSFASVIYIPRPEQQQQQPPSVQQLSLHAPDSTLGPFANNSHSRTPTVPTSPLPCPTPAQSPAPLKGTTPPPPTMAQKGVGGQHLKDLSSGLIASDLEASFSGGRGCDSAKDTMSKRFTFDFEIPDSTTENLLNKNASLIFETQSQRAFQPVSVQRAASVTATPMNEATKAAPPKLGPAEEDTSPEKSKDSVSPRNRFEIQSIPKFNGRSSSSSMKKMASFPILRRSAATPVIPKLVSLEIYNPETDDSDSSEPSSPESIDSVINALEGTRSKKGLKDGSDDDEMETDQRIIATDGQKDIVAPEPKCAKDQPSLEEFAQQLNAQLLKELNESKLYEDLEERDNSTTLNYAQNYCEAADTVELTSSEKKQRSNLRDELRNRRLMLANLNQNGSKRYSQYSSQLLIDGSTDLTIHEEEDMDREGDEDDEEEAVALAEENVSSRCSANCDIVEEDRPLEHQRHVGHIDEDEIPLIGGAGANYRHSQSSLSLESPGGGSVTHHRYYHVFREGELDALINHHVLDLHIVSTYYDRSLWCVVAEKVQVWTI